MSREGALRPAAIVTLGPARARLVNFLLGEAVLPPSSCKGWRWLRLQHGIRKQIRLSLGPDIEVVEPNLSMDSNWDQIPDKILKRTDPMDLSTVMDIELNNPFLENSIQILVPPDLGELSLDDKTPYDFTRESTIKDYEIFYSKRGSLLQNVHPIVLYALDELGPIVPPDKRKTRIKIDPLKSKIEKIPDTSKTFLNKFKDFVIRKDDQKSNCDSVSSFYVPLKNDDGDHDERDNGLDETDFDRIKISETKSDRKSSIDDFLNLESCCYSGLSEENFLDLRQVYELHPNSQVLFILFSDSVERTENSNPTHRLPPNLNVTSANHDGDSSASLENYSLGDSPLSASNYLNSEYGTTESSSVSPMSDYVSSKSTLIQKMVKDNSEANSKSEPCITETKEELSSSVKSGESILFSMDEDKEKLLDKQKAFLSSLVEQLGLMSHPISQQKFTGHWLIVDDSNVSRSTVNGNKQKRSNKSKMAAEEETVIVGEVLQRDAFIYNLVTFSRGCLKNYVLDDCNELSEIHNALLQQFIISSFDMAREMQIVPRKIHYVAVMEQQLYDTLNEKFTGEEKKEELLGIIQRVLQEMKHNVNCIDWEGRESSCHLSEDCINRKTTSSVFYELDNRLQNGDVHHNDPDVTANGSSQPKPDLLDNITDEYLREYYVIDSNPKEMNFNNSLNAELAVEIDSAPENRNGKTNVVNLEVKVQRGNVFDVKIDVDCCKSTQVSFKQASLEIQKAVLARLSRNISIQLVSFVDCLRDSYFGTLQRCLESLEEGRGRRTASEAVRRILLVTRTVNLQQCASFSLLDALVDHLRWFFHRLSLSSGNGRSCCAASPRWRKQVALDTIESLSASRLSRIISLQLRDRIRLSHEQFQSALQALSDHHAARLQQTEELKLTVRKLHAPRFARLCLESTSLRDLVSHGIPHLAKEIGRGQYGVVYAVKGSWAGFEPCAVKSVVPPDERHFNELAMEFFHTRNIPPHDRIVSLCGSVIDHSYSEGGPAVLLVSQRLRCDLHCALLSSDLTFRQRMQIAVDIVEGIRYLHSQGLVHRDIKLKNVLLEELQPRAKITDLGFCIPEAMMSGSIVGTPVHMAPELLSGLYDSSVDVYAFGVLFWYVCAGSVKLPCAFEHFQNKEQLWCNVRKGLRPERLQCFYDSSWELMEKCWSGEPGLRPLLGDVQPILEDLRDNPSRHMNARNIGLNI